MVKPLFSATNSEDSRPLRLIRRSGQAAMPVKVVGMRNSWWEDLYYLLLTVSWPWFVCIVTAIYLTVNTLFAFAYLHEPYGLANAQPGSFIDAFAFSVQTFATIGYGAMYPRTLYTNLVVTFEVLVGLLVIALTTGLAFAKFAKPSARVLFSNFAVIDRGDGTENPTLMFRAANRRRRNQILEAQVSATLVRDETNSRGEFMRRFYDIKLVRHSSPVFMLTWSVMHRIDETSPLFGESAESLAQKNVELIVILTGLDETVAQTVHARHSYVAREIAFDSRFADIISRAPDGSRVIDYTLFHEVAADREGTF